jgi:hypothetical protein
MFVEKCIFTRIVVVQDAPEHYSMQPLPPSPTVHPSLPFPRSLSRVCTSNPRHLHTDDTASGGWGWGGGGGGGLYMRGGARGEGELQQLQRQRPSALALISQGGWVLGPGAGVVAVPRSLSPEPAWRRCNAVTVPTPTLRHHYTVIAASS